MAPTGNKVDDLSTYVKFTSSVFGADKILKILSYGMGFAGHSLMRNDGESLAGKSLIRLGGEISMSRMVNRFFGTTDAIEAVLHDSWSFATDTPRVKALVRLQAWSMVIYHPIEHLSWIGYIKPDIVPKVDAAQLTRVSCYAWVAFILIDFYVCHFRFQQLLRQEKEVLTVLRKKSDITEDELENLQQVLRDIKGRKREILWQVVRDILYFPNAIHWCLKGGLLPEIWVQFLGLAEAVVGSWRMWKSMT